MAVEEIYPSQTSHQMQISLRWIGRLARPAWNHIPENILSTRPLRACGAIIHKVVSRRNRIAGENFPCTFTRFFRNTHLLMVLRDTAAAENVRGPISIASIGCSKGAELYSLLWLINNSRPDLQINAYGVDLSPSVIETASAGCFFRTDEELSWLSEGQVAALFEARGNVLVAKRFIHHEIKWMVGDGLNPSLPSQIGPQDIVLANNFLGAFQEETAERFVDNISRLLKPKGYLVLFGMDLDARTRWIKHHNYAPVTKNIELVHRGDPSMLDWPWTRWGMEPVDKRRRDWQTRYAAIFQAPDVHT